MIKLTNIFAASLLTLSLNSFAASNCAPLSGEYSIGRSQNADYPTIQQAADALMCGGVSSPVVMRLENGIYIEKVTLSNIPGTSALNTVVFESASGEKTDVIVGYQSSDATIDLNGTSYVSFENITVEHNKASYGNCVRVDGKASHVAFKNVVMDGVETEANGSASAVIYLTSAAAKEEMRIQDCELNNGSVGILKGGANTDDRDTKTIITGNLCFNQNEAGMALSNEDAPEIANNVVSAVTTSEAFRGITIRSASNQLIITKNIINTPNGAIGLALTDCEALTTNMAQITNNSIVAGGSGISLNGSTDNLILNFNRVKLSINGGGKAYYANNGTGNNINMLNNIFYNEKTGGYTILGNSYKDFFNQLPGQTSTMTASANSLSIEKVSIK